jgi:hypothetical protein
MRSRRRRLRDAAAWQLRGDRHWSHDVSCRRNRPPKSAGVTLIRALLPVSCAVCLAAAGCGTLPHDEAPNRRKEAQPLAGVPKCSERDANEASAEYLPAGQMGPWRDVNPAEMDRYARGELSLVLKALGEPVLATGALPGERYRLTMMPSRSPARAIWVEPHRIHVSVLEKDRTDAALTQPAIAMLLAAHRLGPGPPAHVRRPIPGQLTLPFARCLPPALPTHALAAGLQLRSPLALDRLWRSRVWCWCLDFGWRSRHRGLSRAGEGVDDPII